MRRLSLLLPLLLVAGCGSGSSGLSSSGPSKADYLSRAEAICKDVNGQIDALSTPTDLAGFQTLVERTVEIAESATSRIKALEPPEKDKADIQRKVIDPLESQLAAGRAYRERVAQAVAAKDQAALGRLLSDPPTGSEADLKWMRSYGFKECAKAAEQR